MKTKIIPLGDRVLVKPFTEAALRQAQGKSKKSKFNFVLPEAMIEEKSAQGLVLAVGESKKLKVGDKVLFSKYAYDEVQSGSETLYILKEEHILAIIKS